MLTNELTTVEINERENGFIAINLTSEQKDLLSKSGIQTGVGEFTGHVETTSELVFPAIYEYVVLGEQKVALAYYNFGKTQNQFIEKNLVDLILSFVRNKEISDVVSFELFGFYLYVIFDLIEFFIDFPNLTIPESYTKITYKNYETSSEADRSSFMNYYNEAQAIFENNYKPFLIE